MNFKFSKAELVAKRVLDECGIDDPTEIPIDEIILGRKAFYNEKPLKGKDGEIVSFGGRSFITVNSEIEYPTKKRFAATHELGHYEMHRNLTPIIFDTEYDLINWYKGGPQEIEANEFASEFLMPSELFYDQCYKKVFGPTVINYLADLFQVSKTAAILKFVRCGNHPICVVYCKDNKMKWWKSSNDFRYFLEFQHDQNPPTGSVAHELFTTKKIYSGNESKQDIWKSDWFRMNDEEPDSKFFEFCIYVQKYQYTLSVIWER